MPVFLWWTGIPPSRRRNRGIWQKSKKLTKKELPYALLITHCLLVEVHNVNFSWVSQFCLERTCLLFCGGGEPLLHDGVRQRQEARVNGEGASGLELAQVLENVWTETS